jgi:hypothetical protein
MVSSSSIAITADCERLACGGFSLSEPVRLGNLEFITDYFGGLSPSPGGATKALFSWLQLAAGHLPYNGPWLRTPLRSSSLHQAGKEASTTLPLDGVAQGPRLPPLQPQHGRGAMQPRQGFPYGRRCHGRKPTTPPSSITLTMKDNRRKPVLYISPLSPDQRHDEATSPASRLLPQSS